MDDSGYHAPQARDQPSAVVGFTGCGDNASMSSRRKACSVKVEMAQRLWTNVCGQCVNSRVIQRAIFGYNSIYKEGCL